MSADVHPLIQSQLAFIDAVKYSRKVINFSTNDLQGLRDIIEIASIVSGGLAPLQKNRFYFITVNRYHHLLILKQAPKNFALLLSIIYQLSICLIV
jgi:hypothetical protein